MLFKTAGFVYGDRHGPSNPCLPDHRSAAQCAARGDRAADVDPPRSVAGADHPASGGGAEPRGDGAPRRGQSTGGGAVGKALHAGRAGRLGRCQGTRSEGDDRARHPKRDPQPGDAAAAKPKALERTHDGQGDGRLEGHGAAAVERQRHQAASGADLQAVPRSAVRGQILGCDRPLSRPADRALVLCCDGKIFAQTAPRHTHRQWLAFLKHLDKQTPADLTLHLVIDNYATHKHPKVKSWIAWRNARRGGRDDGRARFALHFTPTSSSWMNLVERFFRDLTEDAVREGSFASVAELVRAIENYLAERNLAPKRYVWKAAGRDILLKINRARAAAGLAQYNV